MASEPEKQPENGNGHDSGSKDRATVALVDAKVDGLKDLIRAEFATVKEDVKALAAVVSNVIRLEVTSDDHERRISKIESDKTSERDYRRVHLPSIIIACVAMLVTIGTLVVTIASH